jgi:NADH dehydrogenase FAD-containing subunit
MAPITLHSVLVDGSIWLIWAVLEAIDFVLVQLFQVYSLVKVANTQPTITSKKKPHVVIVGASFAGLTVQRHLTSHLKDEVDVTVVDMKTYFEYLPGVLRCFVEPSHFSQISCPLSILRDTTVVTGQVVAVDAAKRGEDQTKNQVKLNDGRKLVFDYLVVAAGSTYTAPIKATTSTKLLTERQEQWNRAAADLAAAKIIVIIGAGAVGVELAGEILTEYPGKRLVMIDMASTILPGFRQETVEYATKWLKTNGAELKLGAPLKELSEKDVVFEDGTKLEVDLIYKCTGGAPNSSFLKSGSLGTSVRGPKGAVVVNDHLQVDGFPHVFCAGDICYHAESNELKLGHTAQVNAHLVSQNLARLVHSSPEETEVLLLNYPSGVVGNSVTPKIYCLSLGKYDATLAMNAMVLSGGFVAVLKWLLEWTQTAAAAQRPIGVLFWFVGDEVSNFLGRTILPTKTTTLGKKTQ